MAFGTATLERKPLAGGRSLLRISGSVTLVGTTPQTKTITIPEGYVGGRLRFLNNGAVTAGETAEIRVIDLETISVSLATLSVAESGAAIRGEAGVPSSGMSTGLPFPLPTSLQLRAVSTNAASVTVLDYVLELFGYAPHSELAATQ